MTWFFLNWSMVLELARDHLLLSVPPIVLSAVIAVPLGRLAYRRPRIGGPLLGAASLLYAIPALPLLIVIPVLLGTPLRSAATMIAALTVYGVALLVRTAADAFTAVDARTRDAAVAVGHSPRAVFWQVDLPLAVPVLLSGVRVVTVSTIGLVTIGALIGVPSLGTLLTDGFQRSIPAEVLAGVIATVLLALLLDGVLLLLGRVVSPWTRAPRPTRSRTVTS
ncbi:ABC transporter permease [Propionibacterium australiense]|uniref:ABC transporter permease subunit n=1 Tax=Propionibacterium australiense TaxID=119981 RepID=A0A383S3E3_9ACTN|nr:ABC transporter permease subunit [Propionibacterium australiense]RLP08901.1 ABC transporter permease subunit [Propionibacterium australiense]RLP11722.1 ABC transporter permease subunit [Propionibacterium australiense]SYZ32467.1 Binding-protein-dependent transport system inner membrane component [Propionibacterium australiense]VEH90153.1 Putative osmoprotectant uptake system permease protein yehY [Propionibacterium australiense]